MRLLISALALLTASISGTSLAAQACGGAETPCVIDSGTYHIVLPETASVKGAVMHLHGGGGTGKGLLGSGLAQEALSRGYIFIAPNGEHPGARFPNNWAVRAQNFGHDKNDIDFLHDVIADVEERHGIDRRRLLLAGFSRGGSMVWDVACEAPGFAHAYAPAAGAFWDELPTNCAGPVRLFHTHGWADRTVPLEGRPLWDGKIAQGDVYASLAIIRAVNGCTGRQPDTTTVEGNHWRRSWTACDGGQLDLLLHPGGHGAPTGWAELVLDWFEEHLTETGD
ncbi:MAG: polyhydroxybutyrate depolymerase [Pseudomonadota bacterium]